MKTSYSLNQYSLLVVLFAAFVGFCAFYAPQPLLPAFTTEYSITATQSAWLLTMPFFCLACGPILVGSLIQITSARTLLSVAMAILGLSLLGFAMSRSFTQLMLFRALQSLTLPVIFTACITYASRIAQPEFRQRSVAFYVSTSILGGFIGRLLSGYLADTQSLQAPFTVFGILALLSSALILWQVKDIPLQGQRIHLLASFGILWDPSIRTGLVIVFTTFFTFSAALTTIPFRLVELQPGIGSSSISLVYSGYAIGVFIPVSLAWLISRGTREIRILNIGALILLLGLIGLAIPNIPILMFVFVLLAAGMFTIHATAAGLLNKLQPDHASVINGAYISNYYFAAAIASVLPLWIIEKVGWNGFVIVMITMVLFAIYNVVSLTIATEAST